MIVEKIKTTARSLPKGIALLSSVSEGHFVAMLKDHTKAENKWTFFNHQLLCPNAICAPSDTLPQINFQSWCVVIEAATSVPHAAVENAVCCDSK
jgi:hypothetical protein